MKSLACKLALSLCLILSTNMAGASSAVGLADSQRFRIHVYDDGVYRIDYEQLQASGLDRPVSSEQLAMTNEGRATAIRVDDGGDGQFGPGDGVVFVGMHLRGKSSHYHDYSPFNVYVLTTAVPNQPRRLGDSTIQRSGVTSQETASLIRSLHLERDLLRIPISGPTGRYGSETLWYWKQLNHMASEPTRIPIDLSHLDPGGESAFGLEIQLRGGSDYASSASLLAPDHTVEIALNGNPIGQASWQGRDVHRIEISPISPSLVRTEDNAVEIRVPTRRHGSENQAIIDVVYLDWIKATFPRDKLLADRQERLQIQANAGTAWLRLDRSNRSDVFDSREPINIFGEDGFHATALPSESDQDIGTGTRLYEAPVPTGEQAIWVVPGDRFKRPPLVEQDRPSNLTGDRTQRDYFIVAHHDFTHEIAPLAEFHEQRGMSTEIVDVQDIYDEFNSGIEHPRAIRDFLVHARATRQAPAPTYVLLVGDANWYSKVYEEAIDEQIHHNQHSLIPTWHLRTRDGPAASDNPFVDLVGNDFSPEMAIGRFPANTPAEVTAMVNKTIAYMRQPTPGPWRSRVLLASDRERNLAARNEQLAQRTHNAGLRAEEFLPAGTEDGEKHQDRLRSAIDTGMLVLHFFGHGGRYMWQTAPSRDGNGRNLFDMEDLDRLAPSSRLPIVLSMSCNTGPFDHPAVDSLAEKFMRMQDRGAVAVLAASARNSPSLKFTNALLDGILYGETLGETVREAKSARQHPDAALLYNLLGDPALIPARPKLNIRLEITSRNPLEVQARLESADFSGQAIVQWLTGAGKPISQRMELQGPSIVLRPPEPALDGGYVRLTVHAWNKDRDLDATGTTSLKEE